MDILDSVREMKPTYPASAQAPRRALHQEIARSRRRPVRRILITSVAGAAVAAVAVTAPALLPSAIVGQPQAASAATYLNETAAVMRASATGQPTEVTITTQHLGMVGGPNEKFQPFGDFRTGATGAAITEFRSVYVNEPDGTYSEASHTDIHVKEIFGDEAAVRDAWGGYYGSEYPIGEEPATTTETLPSGYFDEPLPVPTTDFPAEPAEFLAAWQSGMEAQMVAEKAEAAKMPMDGEPETNGLFDSIEERFAVPAAEFMLDELGHSVPILIASPEYRATFLEALALADGITVTEDSTSNKVLVYEGEDERFRLTINPSAGAIVKLEKFLLRALPELWNKHTEDDPLVEVGSAPFLPAETPSFAATFTSEPLG